MHLNFTSCALAARRTFLVRVPTANRPNRTLPHLPLRCIWLFSLVLLGLIYCTVPCSRLFISATQGNRFVWKVCIQPRVYLVTTQKISTSWKFQNLGYSVCCNLYILLALN